MVSRSEQGMERRPKFTEEIGERVCELLMDGYSMRQIAERPEMPSRMTLLRRLASDAEFRVKVAAAREAQADLMDERILAVADGCDETNYQAARVKISAYQWRAAKLAPKKYGDRTALEHSGPDAQPLAPPVFHIRFVESGQED